MYNPPVILQQTETEFHAAIEAEFVTGSAIAPSLFTEISEFASDQEFENGEVIGLPIAEFLNWKISESQNGFGPAKDNTFGVFLRNEDGTPWQAKLNYQTWNSEKSRYSKPYKAPRLSECELPPAYLPPICAEIRAACGVPSDGSFWEYVEAHPELPIVLTEGAKKSLCALSHGIIAIAIYGCDAGSKKINGEHTLIPDLARFCQPGRTFIVAFDRDSNPETVERVKAATGRLSWLLGKQSKGITVKVAAWKPSQGKGVDDLVVNCGAAALDEAIANATAPPREIPWKCLPVHHHQIGIWKTIEVPVSAVELIQRNHERANWDPNLKYEGSRNSKDGPIEIFREFEPQANFDLKVSKILEDSTGGGIEFEITWMERSTVRTRRALVKTSEMMTPKDFVIALTKALGGHFTSILKPNALASIIQNRKTEYSRKGGRVYRLTDRVGQQPDGTWVFEHCQFKADGTLTTDQESGWVWNPALSALENIPSPAIAPQSPDAIPNLIKALAAFYHADAMPYALLTMGYAVMGLHRSQIMAKAGSVASLAIYGDKGGGKSTAQQAAAALYGLHDYKLSTVTESAFFELAKSLGNLPIQWDDPIRQGKYAIADEEKVNNVLWKLFTALARVVRGNTQAPNTTVAVSTNRTLGTGNAAILSRLISFIFPVLPVNRKAGEDLKRAMDGASGGLSQLLAIQYDHEAVVQSGNQLIEHLKNSDARNAQSLAALAYFTQQFCNIAGYEFDALQFIKTDVCPQTDEQGAGKDSLTDFIEKLETLKADGTIGDWNLTERETRDGKKYLGIHLPSVWEAFESRFKPNYGQSLIAQLAENAGGAKNQKGYFIESKDAAIAYKRALTNFEMGLGEQPREPKRDRQAKALLIPRAVAEKAGFYPTHGEEPTAAEPSEPIAEPQQETPWEPAKDEDIAAYVAETELISVGWEEVQSTKPIAATQPALGTWESEEPPLWTPEDLAAARETIAGNPEQSNYFKTVISRSQWKQVGIKEG